jgi:hypothetical protein
MQGDYYYLRTVVTWNVIRTLSGHLYGTASLRQSVPANTILCGPFVTPEEREKILQEDLDDTGGFIHVAFLRRNAQGLEFEQSVHPQSKTSTGRGG